MSDDKPRRVVTFRYVEDSYANTKRVAKLLTKFKIVLATDC
ncbi:MAG: hypothetical protein PUP90_24480 [Nostoc sp. S4]|nr:hypothetical protein [Nostoc sp. S4]